MTTAGQSLDLKSLRIVQLPSSTALDKFRCGEDSIDRHLPQCCEWEECHRARVFCAYLPGDDNAVGFYCIGIQAHDADTARALFAGARADSRKFVPFIYLHYLAVRGDLRRRKIGTMLLGNSLERSAVAIRNVGAYGVARHALNDVAIRLYERYGFRPVDDKMRFPTMVLPARSVLELPAKA